MSKKKSWEKRLQGEPDHLTVGFVESLSLDRRLYKYDIAGSVAHARMLARQEFISAAELKKIEVGLKEIEGQIEAGRFAFDEKLEDIHMAIESALVDKVGQAGKKLHTGRSRNDQIATDIRLWMREEIGFLQARVSQLQRAFVTLAAEYAEAVMPGYTHLQRAQPVVIGSYLLSFVEQLERDFVRLGNCGRQADVCPLGSGALAGSTLGLDRRRTAAELGFSRLSDNSIDAVSDRDFAAEFIFDCAMIGTHLSRLAEDWIIYSSTEFGFLRIDDRYCTSSSMMPQKRNPDMLELMRGKAAGLYGNLMAMLAMLKAQPTAYNRDLQEDKVHIFSAADTTRALLDAARGVVSNSRFDTERISKTLERGFLDATALAEYLVARGVAFREAHQIVGTVVLYCEKQGKTLEQLSLEEFRRYCGYIEPDVYEYLGPERVVEQYRTEGSAGRQATAEQIASWRQLLAER